MAKVITTELQHSGASGANITLDSSKNVTCENNLTVDGTSTLTGAVTLPDNTITNSKVADDAIGVAELSATGTASASTFLRGDNAWAAAGGGKILQVIHSTYSTESSATSEVTTGLACTITPSATNSKIYINYRLANCRRNGHAGAYGRVKLYRGDAAYGSGTQTNIYQSSNGFGYHASDGADTLDIGDNGGIWLDSPNTTSATTYTVTIMNISGSDGVVKWSTNNSTSSMVVMEVSA